jgi:late competence protein required for DNA uptake (superfamily II DNA/RNA helicase)
MAEDKEKRLKLISEIQRTVEQMKVDDIEEQPYAASELFQCPCCGEFKPLAGSLLYNANLYCNDCVLLTEVSLALGKITYPDEMIEYMEDKRFEAIYEGLFSFEENLNN